MDAMEASLMQDAHPQTRASRNPNTQTVDRSIASAFQGGGNEMAKAATQTEYGPR